MTGDTILKVEQFRFEHFSWERLLDFFKQENTYLKTRLAEVLDKNMGKEILPYAEHFQNQFIIKDEFIDELKHEIHVLQQGYENLPNQNIENEDKKLNVRQNKLRNEMEYFEKDFTNLKNEFTKYLLTVL
jgi:hypothetical protein